MSIFSPIIAGAESCHKILENDGYLSFLEKKPLKEGHCVVIPKREVDFVFDLEENELRELMSMTRRVARAIRDSIECKKVAVAVLGLEVRHAHIHLVPVNQASELNFTLNRLVFTDAEFAVTAKRILTKLQ